MKSDERAMGNWALVHSVLKISPTIKTGKLKDALREQIGRTDLYEFLKVYENKNLIVRPTRGLIVLVDKADGKDSAGFFGWLERREEKKARKKAEKLRSLRVECRALMEEAGMNEDDWTPEKAAKIRQKHRKILSDS